MTIRWRKLPSHARQDGWVGIPIDREGQPVDHIRYYINIEGDAEHFPILSQYMMMDCGDVSWWQFNVAGDNQPFLDVAQMRCLNDWLGILIDQQTVMKG